MVVAPERIASSTQRQRKSGSVRVASSALHCTSSVKLRARATEAPTASSTAFGPICSLCFMCTGLVEMKVWMRKRLRRLQRFAGAVDILEAGAREAADDGVLRPLGDLVAPLRNRRSRKSETPPR